MSRQVDPTRARRGTGNRPKPGEAKVREMVVLPRPVLPSVPPGLPDEAGDMFQRVVAEIGPNALKEGDLEALGMMCHSAWVHRQAREQIAATGVLVKGPRGPMVNPLIKVARDEAQVYLKIANEFGLTMAARLRLGLMQLAGESILQSLNKELDEGLG